MLSSTHFNSLSRDEFEKVPLPQRKKSFLNIVSHVYRFSSILFLCEINFQAKKMNSCQKAVRRKRKRKRKKKKDSQSNVIPFTIK